MGNKLSGPFLRRCGTRSYPRIHHYLPTGTILEIAPKWDGRNI